MRDRKQRDYSFTELVVAIGIIGILIAVAITKFVALANEVQKKQVKATAENIKASVSLIRAKAIVSDVNGAHNTNPKFEYSYDGKTGQVVMYPDTTGAPVNTLGFVDSHSRSYKLWDLLASDPSIKDKEDPKKTGWYATGSTVTTENYVYAWDYYVDGQRIARLQYDARQDIRDGAVKVLWDP